MQIDIKLQPAQVQPALERFLQLAGRKILKLNKDWDPAQGSPVFTVDGRYTARGWTEWTQGFQFGCQILQFDATGDERLLELGLANTIRFMAPHVSHTGVHDHGFNNLSTYGNLRRLTLEGRWAASRERLDFLELALKISGAVQAARWTRLADGTGFIHSFNGPHSLFSDTIRSCRSLVLTHQLDHVLGSRFAGRCAVDADRAAAAPRKNRRARAPQAAGPTPTGAGRWTPSFTSLRTGCQWNGLPRSLGSDRTAHDYFQKWTAANVFERLWRLLIRWEKKKANYLAMLHLTCAFITFHAAGVLG